MRTRRQFFCLSATTLLAVATEWVLRRRPSVLSTAVAPLSAEAPQARTPGPIWLPLAQSGAPVAIAEDIAPRPAIAQTAGPGQVYLPIVRHDVGDADDLPILGWPSGTAQQAADWLAPRASGYTSNDVATIVAGYAELGDQAGIDWFLALAQLAHETGHLTSWWSQPPRRNPAGIGVTGVVRPGSPNTPPAIGWTWDGTQWREGLSFTSWPDEAIPAHLGRLLAYALTDTQANSTQHTLIARALAYRPLTESYRGAAPTIVGLNGRWAVPGTNYGQSIMALMRRMRA